MHACKKHEGKFLYCLSLKRSFLFAMLFVYLLQGFLGTFDRFLYLTSSQVLALFFTKYSLYILLDVNNPLLLRQ